MITKELKVWIGNPGGTPPVIRLSQYDDLWEFIFDPYYDGAVWDIPSGATVTMQGKKPDGNAFAFAGTVVGRKVSVLGNEQMTAVPGVVLCELRFEDAHGRTVGTANFALNVERAPMQRDDIISKTETSILRKWLDDTINEINDLADTAAQSASSAAASARTSYEQAADKAYAAAMSAGLAVESAGRAESAATRLESALRQIQTALESGVVVDIHEDETATKLVVEYSNGGTDEIAVSGGLAFDCWEYDENYYLHLYDEEGNDVIAPVYIPGGGGGGGGSTTSSVVTLRNLMGTSAISIPFGADVSLRYSFASTLDGIETGNGQCKLYVNSALKGTYTAMQGENTIAGVGRLISEGTNTVRLMVSDEYGTFKSLNFTITAVSLQLRSSFNDGQIFTGAATIKYTPIGAIEKTTIVKIDGEEYHRETTTASRQQSTLEVPFISHGVHPVEIWTQAELNGVAIESDHLHFNLCFAQEGNAAPFVALRAASDEVSQGDLMELYFLVYDPSNLRVQVQQIIQNEDGTTYQTATMTADRTRQHWTTKRYPAGNLTFKIVYGSIEAAVMVKAKKPDIDVSAVTNDLDAYLYAEGRDNSETNKEVWEDGDVTTTFSGMNWVTNGWMTDDNGDKRLKVTGGGRAIVGLKPFGDDLRRHGKTVEIEFMVHDANTLDDAVISCMEESTGIGFEITGDTARISSEMSSVECNFKQDKKVCVAFTVESTSEYRLLSISLNGYLTQMVQYPETDNFEQSAALPITIGCATCGVSIYKIRSYSTALTQRELVNNFIADTADISEKIALYEQNNIYDEYNNMLYSAVVDQIPAITIVGDLPTFKGDKKTDVFKFENTEQPTLDFEKTGQNDVQGTSSQWYVRKNFKGKFSDALLFMLGQLATKTICLKADYAEATSTHNTQWAMFVETMYTEKSPAQEIDARCRRTIYGFPIVVFHQQTESDTPVFVGKYNFNCDKNSAEVYGFENFPNVQRWEVANNTSDSCNFRSADLGDKPEDNFELQYPDSDNPDYSKITDLIAWVASTNQDAATNATLPSTYTGADGTKYNRDTAEYRLAKFKKEFTQHMNLHCSTVYYVDTFFALMTDQRAKNMHLICWDVTATPCIWEPWFYDNDTIFGINNEGEKRFKYWHEDTDQLNGANVYNGQNSVLWVNFRMAFADEIAEEYRRQRNEKLLTFDKLVDRFITNGSRKWCANIYNDDSDYKYISMVRDSRDTSNLPQIKGNGEDDHEYFFDRRLMYCDSKFQAGDFVDDTVSLRIYTPTEWAGVEPNANVTLTSASNMYQAVRYKANGELQKQRVEAGVPTTHTAPGETFNDTEFAAYGASELSSLGDLSALYCGSVNASKATRLLELIVGSAVSGYQNNNLISLSVGANTMLQKLNVMNCPKLRQNIDLSGCTGIEEIYAKGSGITGVTLPEGGYLRVMELPATVTNLTVKNQNYIETFSMESYSNLTTLWVENSNGIPILSIINAATRLSRLRVTGVNWSFNDADTLMSFMEIGGIDENGYNTSVAVIEGHAHVTTLKASERNDLARAFPNLEVTSDVFINQHKVTFQNEDGTVLDIQYIDRGGAAVDPIAREILPIATPTKAPTVDQTFTFNTWDRLLSPILEDTVITATYTAHVRQYTVSFYSVNTLLEQKTVDVYTAAEYTGEMPKRSEVAGSYLYYLFTGWDKDFSNVTSDMNVYAVFAECGVPAQKVELSSGQKLTDVYTVNEIYAVCRSDLFKNYFEPFDEIEIQLENSVVSDTSIILQVADFNHFKKAGSDEFAHVAFFMKGALAQGLRMNPTSTNAGGYPETERVKWLNEKMITALPQIWRSMIETVTVLSSAGSQSANIVSVDCKLWQASHCEVGFDKTVVPYRNEVDADAENMQFPIFSDSNSRIKKTFNGEGNAVSWGLRSPDSGSSTGFRSVNNSGSAYSNYATTTYSVCFGFCVG